MSADFDLHRGPLPHPVTTTAQAIRLLGVSDTTAALVEALVKRDAAGRAKYGTTLDRADLSHADWLQHAAEEALDMAGYLLAAKREHEAMAKELESLRFFQACVVGEGLWERWLALEGAVMGAPGPHADDYLGLLSDCEAEFARRAGEGESA